MKTDFLFLTFFCSLVIIIIIIIIILWVIITQEPTNDWT